MAAFNAARVPAAIDVATRIGLHGQARRRFRQHAREQQLRLAAAPQEGEKTQGVLQRVSQVWNDSTLRRGDRLDPVVSSRRNNHGRHQQTHPRAWTVSGTIRLAFSRLGALAPRASSLRPTKRPLDAVAVVSVAASDHQMGATKTQVRSWQCAERPPKWIFLGRSHDCTPIRVGFGALRELASVARYWFRISKNTLAQLLTPNQYLQHRTTLPAFGIVELMGQTGEICWPDVLDSGFVAIERKRLLFPPCYVGRANASTLFAALDQVDPHLSVAQSIALAATVDIVVLFIGSDLAPACTRAKQEVAERILEHNSSAAQRGLGIIILINGHCAAHILHREIEHSFGAKSLIPKLYSVAYACSLPAN